MPAAAKIAPKDHNLPKPLVTRDELALDFDHIVKAIIALEVETDGIPPVIEDDDDLNEATALARKLIQYAKRCEEIRDEQNRPHLDAQKVNNEFFKHDLIARITTAKAKLETISNSYLKKKAAREQAARDAQAAEARRQAEAAAAAVSEAVKAGDVPAASAAVVQSNTLAGFAAKTTAAAAAPTSHLARTATESGTATLVDRWTFEAFDMNTIDLNALRPFLNQAHVEAALRQFIKAGRREIVGARIFNDNKTRFGA